MAKRKKNRSGRMAVEARKKRLQGDSVRYKCLACEIEEEIPRRVVEMFDILDDDGDLSVPPRFSCKECDGQMEPIEYMGVHGVTYEIVSSEEIVEDKENWLL
jgi:hypothetical protein